MSSAFDRPSNNDTSQPEDALIPEPELAPKITTEVQRSPDLPHLTNQNLFTVLVKNRRQITSLTAGIHAHATQIHCQQFIIIAPIICFSIIVLRFFYIILLLSLLLLLFCIRRILCSLCLRFCFVFVYLRRIVCG